jgi:hypothetical protein
VHRIFRDVVGHRTCHRAEMPAGVKRVTQRAAVALTALWHGLREQVLRQMAELKAQDKRCKSKRTRGDSFRDTVRCAVAVVLRHNHALAARAMHAFSRATDKPPALPAEKGGSSKAVGVRQQRPLHVNLRALQKAAQQIHLLGKLTHRQLVGLGSALQFLLEECLIQALVHVEPGARKLTFAHLCDELSEASECGVNPDLRSLCNDPATSRTIWPARRGQSYRHLAR